MIDDPGQVPARRRWTAVGASLTVVGLLVGLTSCRTIETAIGGRPEPVVDRDYDYYVYRSGSMYYAQSKTGRVAHAGRAPNAVVEACVDAFASTGGTIVLGPHEFAWQRPVQFRTGYADYVKVVGTPGAKIVHSGTGNGSYSTFTWDRGHGAITDDYRYIWLENLRIDARNRNVCLAVVLRRNNRRPSFASNYGFHCILALWLCWFSVPWLGQMP